MKRTFNMITVLLIVFCCCNMITVTANTYSVVKYQGKEYVQDESGELSEYFDANGNPLTANEAIDLLTRLEQNEYIEESYNLNHKPYSVVEYQNKEYIKKENGELALYFDKYGNELSCNDVIKLLSEFEYNEKIMNDQYVYLHNKNKLTRATYPYLNEVHYQSKSTKYIGGRLKVTPDVQGELTISKVDSIKGEYNFGGDINITSEIRSYLEHEMENCNDGRNEMSNSTINVEAKIPDYKIGAIYFMPLYIRYNCIYYNQDGKAIIVYMEKPQVSSDGYSDGLYELVLH